MREYTDADKEKLLSRKEIDENGCWNYTMSTSRNGYGQVWLSPGIAYSHRMSYELHFGEIPDGLLVRHTCDNRKCFNPEHLVLGTNADNMQDVRDRGHAKVVTGSGEEHYNAVLDEELVLSIRDRFSKGEKVSKMSKELGHSISTLHRAIIGETWTHLPNAQLDKVGRRKRDEELLSRGLKICIRCRVERSVSEFTKNSKSWDGLRADCRPCHRGETA